MANQRTTTLKQCKPEIRCVGGDDHRPWSSPTTHTQQQLLQVPSGCAAFWHQRWRSAADCDLNRLAMLIHLRPSSIQRQIVSLRLRPALSRPPQQHRPMLCSLESATQHRFFCLKVNLNLPAITIRHVFLLVWQSRSTLV